jgi:hypothetical protein
MKECKIKWCHERYACNGYCAKHAVMFRRLGYIKKTTNRTRNKIIEDGNIAKIELKYKDKVFGYAIIDSADISIIRNIKWAVHNGYAISFTLNKNMHNLITGYKLADHINGNRLDNRRCNLRPATLVENARNSSGWKNSKCPYKGVSPDNMSKNKPYSASICGKRIGRYSTQEEAAWMYDQYAIQLFGEFARLNFEYL